MSREIKFRGWHTKLQKMFSAEEMAADQLTMLTTGAFINVSGSSQSQSVIYPRDKFIPLQFTGLKDKNGREIYEGDVIDGWMGKQVVEFNDGQFDPFGAPSHGGHEWDNEEASKCEIIGNIHENPELIK